MAVPAKKNKASAKAKLAAKRKAKKLPARKKAKKSAKKKPAKKVKAKKVKAKKAPAKKKSAAKASKTSTPKTRALKTRPLTTKAPAVIATPAESTVTMPAQATPATITTPETPRVAAGDWAPTFSLPDQDGNLISLDSYKGKKVVLYFYPKDDTPGCTKEACSFRDNLPTFEGADAVILGVSFDDQASHQKFIDKYQLNFKLLSDSNKEVAKLYGCYVQKNMYGNISWGIERSTFVIDREGKIVSAFRRVQVDGHTEEVLAALRQIS